MKFPNQAKTLKKIMASEALNLGDVAERLGVSLPYVSNMVNGKAGIPAERVFALGVGVPNILRAAERDFRIGWIAKAKKGLQKVKSNGKPPKHEKTKGR